MPVTAKDLVVPVAVKANQTSLGAWAEEQAGRLMPFWKLVVAPTFEPLMVLPVRVMAPQGSSLAGAASVVAKENGPVRTLLPLKPPQICRT